MSAGDAVERRSRIQRLVVWTLPLANVALAIVAQLAVPRLLQLGLSETDYTLYVALTSVAAYVGLGEGGVLVSLLRELSRRHGSSDAAGFALEARRSRRVFLFAALVGGVLAALALGSQSRLVLERSAMFMMGALALIAGSMLELALGSFQSAMLFSTGRYLAGQLSGMASVVGPLVALVGSLLVTRDLSVGVWAQAGTVATMAIARGVHGSTVLARESRDATGEASPAPLGSVVGPGALLKLAEVLQSASYPHLLTVVAPWVVPGAIPARTYANATKLVTQQFVNLLQVHVTRDLAGDAEARARARENYAIAAAFLSSLQLLELGVAAALARFVFQAWLPNQAAYVGELLPGMFAWQALLAASLPADILFFAAGHMRLLGIARIGATALGLAAVAIGSGLFGRAALGLGLALSAAPLAAFGLWGELTILQEHTPAPRRIVLRYGLALAAALGSLMFGSHPFVAAGACIAGALVGLPSSLRGLGRLLKRR